MAERSRRRQLYPKGTTLPAGTYLEVLDDRSWFNRRAVTRWRPARVVDPAEGERAFDAMLLVHDDTCLWWWNNDDDHADVRPGRACTRVWFHTTRLVARTLARVQPRLPAPALHWMAGERIAVVVRHELEERRALRRAG